MTDILKDELRKYALQIRIGTIECIKSRGFGHVGGSLSIADLLAVLYGSIMRIDPNEPLKKDRDKLVCSKGHAGPAVYSALALKGFFPYEELKTLNQPGTRLPSHCDRNKTPGVDMTTGSLGQGASLAAGMALGDNIAKRNCTTYLIVGDGELNEGQIWEAAMFTAAKKINNLVWIIDWNKKQLDGYVEDILNPYNIEEKFSAFGFDVCTIDGHDVEQIYKVLTKKPKNKPIAIILDTVKGKGVVEVEETMNNHSLNVGMEVFDRWLEQLNSDIKTIGN